ncbi:MAG: hypothetical protein DMF81_13390 [Acidobacteria bacterium]|nr:MAG: hypothetical protein DMF81_13390 [Acidobacteriota bacterium]
MKVAFLGATRGMGRSLSRLMAARGDELFLLGREPAGLERSARDLEARAGRGSVGVAVCDLEQPAGFAAALDAAEAGLGGLDAVVVTAGVFATQDVLEQDWRWTSPTRSPSASTPGAGCWPGEAARSSSSARWPEREDASRSSSTAPPRPASPGTWRDSTTGSTPRACERSA